MLPSTSSGSAILAGTAEAAATTVSVRRPGVSRPTASIGAAAPDDEVGRPRQTVRPETDPRPEAGESGAAGAAGEQEAGGRPHGCDGDERDRGQPQRQRPRSGLLADQEHEQVRRDRERQPALGEHEEAEHTGHSPARRAPGRSRRSRHPHQLSPSWRIATITRRIRTLAQNSPK